MKKVVVERKRLFCDKDQKAIIPSDHGVKGGGAEGEGGLPTLRMKEYFGREKKKCSREDGTANKSWERGRLRLGSKKEFARQGGGGEARRRLV